MRVLSLPSMAWDCAHEPDMHRALSVERTLSTARLVLFGVSLSVALVERPIGREAAAVPLLSALLAASVVVAVALRRGRIATPGHVMAVHLLDLGGITLAVILTGGLASPFSTVLLFVLLAAGYRWGNVETWATGAVGTLALAGHASLTAVWNWPQPMDVHVAALRLIYFAVGALLIGYMAEHERRLRHRAATVSRILSRVRANGGLVATVQEVMGHLLVHFGARNAVLVLEEEGHDRVSVWSAERADDKPAGATVRLTQEPRDRCGTFLFPVPKGVDAWAVRRADDRAREADSVPVTLDANGARIAATLATAPLFETPFPWRTAFCLSSVSGEGWSGRLFVFGGRASAAGDEQLRFLQAVVNQVAPALFNLYLQRRLQSRTGVVERARISRELHDGVIQSLIGAEMQLEVLRREQADHLPPATAAQLTSIQNVLRDEVLNVRDLMQLLKPVEVDAKRLVEHLADAVEQFRHRTGISAQLACEVDDIDLPPRVCRELASIVQESLANVRKHSGATKVLVSLGSEDGHWRLIVDDNGSGLDFEGRLASEELDAMRKGPVIIKERARATGARLDIHSQPGFGTRVEVSVPRRHHA